MFIHSKKLKQLKFLICIILSTCILMNPIQALAATSGVANADTGSEQCI